MNPNPEIYGTPEQWHNTYIYDSTTMAGASILRCSRPKVPDFDGTSTYTSSQLLTGIAEEKIEKNKPIDKSICPCGQDVGASHLHFIGVYTNRNRNQYPNEDIQRVTTIVNMGMRTTPINWCFFERRVPNTYGSRAFGVWRIENDTDTYRVWAPNSDNSVNPTNHTNGNYYVSPFLDYQLKSILLQIQVFRITGRNATTQIPTGSWIALESWKNDYPTDSIAGARLQMLAPSSNGTNLSQITYYSVSPASERGFGAMILDEIPVGETSYSISPSFMSFGIQGDGNGYIYFFDIIQNLYGDKSDSDLTYGFLPCDGAFTGSETKTYRGTASPYGAVWQEVPYDDDTYESLMSMAALYGCYFTPTATKVFLNAFTHADLCLPIIDDNGVAHGDYTRGADNPANDLYNVDKVQDKNYSPSAPVDPNTYSLATGFNVVGDVASTTKQYVINGDGLKGLSGEMWSIMSDLIVNPEDVENLSNLSLDAFLTNNPIDAIVSVKKFPLDHVPHGENLDNVWLGKYETGAAAYELATQQAQYNFSAIPVYPKFGGCFLDYAPYTTMQLYIPFCGTIEIDPADFMGRNLSVEMNMDFITGTVTAYVLSNELVIQTATGQCAIDIPITGTESATVDAAYQSAVINERQARNKYYQAGLGVLKHPIKTFLSPVSTTLKSISTAQSWAQTEYELTHIQEPLRQIGAASPLNSWALEFVCRLIIYYPDGEIITFNANNEPALIDEKVKEFGAVNGFATVETGTLNNFEGFTQVSSVDLDNVKATQNELEMIRNLLQGGVYL